MRFKCSDTPEEKQLKALAHKQAVNAEAVRLVTWHEKFALWPKHFPSGYCVWMGRYYQRFNPPERYYNYRYDHADSRSLQKLMDTVAELVADLWSGNSVHMRMAEKAFNHKSNWEYKETL